MKHSSSAATTTAATAAALLVASSVLTYHYTLLCHESTSGNKKWSSSHQQQRRAYYASLSMLAPRNEQQHDEEEPAAAAAARCIQRAWGEYKQKGRSPTTSPLGPRKRQQAAFVIQRAWKKLSGVVVFQEDSRVREKENHSDDSVATETAVREEENHVVAHNEEEREEDASFSIQQVCEDEDEENDFSGEAGSADKTIKTSTTSSSTVAGCDGWKEDSKSKASAALPASHKKQASIESVRFIILLLLWCSSVWWILCLFPSSSKAVVSTPTMTAFTESSTRWSRRRYHGSIHADAHNDDSNGGGGLLMEQDNKVHVSASWFLQDFYPME
jgi:hypothetical protein